MVDVEQWAELRREHFVRGVSIKQLVARTGLSRNTVRAALRAPAPPKYERAPAGSKLDPFKDEIHRLLKSDAAMPGQRIRELIAPLGYVGGKTIVDDYLREVRPFFVDQRTFQRTVYRLGEICQFDVWEPKDEIAVGHGQTRQAYVVVACLGYSRAGAGRGDLLQADPGLAVRYPALLVVARGAAANAGLGSPGRPARDGRPTDHEFAGFCGQLKVDWHFCDARDPQAKGVVERLQDFMERSFEPGRAFANELDCQLQLDCWFSDRANARMHKTLRARPIDRLIEERAVMAPLPATMPDTDRRWVLRVPPDPYLRFDTCDYSLDPGLVGRRVEIRVDEREITAVALDTGEIACRHQRSFAKHRTITALEHARTLKTQRGERRGEPVVEVRSLALYDELIA